MGFSLSVALLEPSRTFQMKMPDRNDTYCLSPLHVSPLIFVKSLKQSHHLCIQEHRMKLEHDFAHLSDKFHLVGNNKEPGTGDTGFDLVAVEQTTILQRGSAVVPVGLTLADITPGYWIRIEPRSGLGFKHNLQPHLGVIDNGYRGDLAVKLYNFSDN